MNPASDTSKNNERVFYVLHIEDEPRLVDGVRTPALDVLERWYGVEVQDVEWEVVGSREVALERLAEARRVRGARGYDAIFVDFRIFDRPETKGGIQGDYIGLELLKELDPNWAGACVCISTFAADEKFIGIKEATDVRIDDWLHRHEPVEVLRAKLTRCLVPVERFAAELQQPPAGELPLIFRNERMKAILREVIFLARRPYHSWPLAKILLLGPPGSGKGAFSRAFHRVLPRELARAPLVRYNCACAVTEGHGGRIALFGARRFGNQVSDQPGLFERATWYGNRSKAGLAEDGEVPQWNRAGVVFLDEFAELAPELQASILTAVDEGEVRREGDGSLARIGCHVVFATNQPAEHLVAVPDEVRRLGGRVRHDLVDRIPHVFEVPPLSRRVDEIRIIIEELASAHLKRFDPARPSPKVTLTPAADMLINRAVRHGLLTSVRELDSIASVLPGETRISDVNLRSLFAKAELFDKVSLLRPDAVEHLSVKTQAMALSLPEELRRDDLPEFTVKAIRRLFVAFDDARERIRHHDLKEDIGGNQKRGHVGSLARTSSVVAKRGKLMG